MLLKESFYFVRHGETDYNRNRLCAGSRIDAPLNKTGKGQAKSLRDKIESLPIKKVICSPLKRTIQTAKLATSLPLVLEHDIRECDLGDFEGKPVPDFIKHIETTSPSTPFPNGESRHEVAKRAVSAVSKFLLAHGEGLLFVSHGIVYWALLETLGIPFHYIENAELIHFKPQKDTWASLKV
jgi:broad specificity phosphatase PhoE